MVWIEFFWEIWLSLLFSMLIRNEYVCFALENHEPCQTWQPFDTVHAVQAVITRLRVQVFFFLPGASLVSFGIFICVERAFKTGLFVLKVRLTLLFWLTESLQQLQCFSISLYPFVTLLSPPQPSSLWSLMPHAVFNIWTIAVWVRYGLAHTSLKLHLWFGMHMLYEWYLFVEVEKACMMKKADTDMKQ